MITPRKKENKCFGIFYLIVVNASLTRLQTRFLSPFERVRNNIFAWLHRRGDLSEIFFSECTLEIEVI